MATDSAKLDLILASVNNLNTSVNSLNSKFDKLEAKVTVIESKVATQDLVISDLQSQLTKLKTSCNIRDQESRSSVFHIFNFPTSEAEVADGNKGLSSKIYEKVLKPIRTAAKNKGELAALPQLQTVMADWFRIRAPNHAAADSPPPTVVFKLSSSLYKTVIMKNKKDNIPQVANSSPIFITEDLTPDTHRRMMDIKQDKRVAKVWTVNGQIRLTLHSAPSRVVNIKSAYGDIEKLLSK